MRSAPGRGRSRHTPPSPACAGRSGPIRWAAPTCWRRAACASSPAGSTPRCTLPSGTTRPGTSPIRCTSALTRSSRAAVLALTLLSLCPSIRLSAQTIDTIVVVNHNIFDLEGDAPGFLARLANRLHVTTRAGVIRRTLLVNPGDRYDSARVAESERALRSLYVFSRVRLDTTRIAGRLALRVTTSDGWSTKPQLGYSSAGGDATWLAGRGEKRARHRHRSVRRVQQDPRSEEHTSELQSQSNLVCRLLLGKKNTSRAGQSPANAPLPPPPSRWGPRSGGPAHTQLPRRALPALRPPYTRAQSLASVYGRPLR